jgi:triosephosphate isomerase
MTKSNSRGTLVAGNWKMFKNLAEARQLATDILAGLPRQESTRPTVGFFPNAVALAAVAEAANGRESQVLVGAQNLYHEPEGAFTGEISADMILSAGARGVVLGHSERRHIFGETSEQVGRKVARALEAGLIPVLCVGETLEEREDGRTENVVEEQLLGGLADLSPEAASRVVIAYEPVWAIGTGKTATPEQGQAVQQFLRTRLGDHLGSAELADGIQILYGGSVKPANAKDLIAQPDIDGFLVGGASLDADSFLKICAATA